MKDQSTDHSDYIRRITQVLSGKEPANEEDLLLIKRLSELAKAPDFDVQRGYERLSSEIQHRERARRDRRLRYLAAGAAAAAVVGLIVAVLLPTRVAPRWSDGDPMVAEQVRETYFLPDSLFDIHDLQLIRDDGSLFHLRLSDRDTLRLSELAPVLRTGEMVSLVVPETRRGVVQLEDGTVVTLNSVSRLSMPTSFDGAGRGVSLEEGEALMQVAHDERHPFVVSVRDMSLEVLGTTFNVCLYPEQRPTATLVEGKLRVTGADDSSVILSPGEEAVYGPSGLVSRQADLATRTAWVEGKFVFSHLPLSSIMAYLGRWYGFETEYADDSLRDNSYTGALSKEYSKDFVFGVLEKTTRLKIINQYEGRRVVVNHR